MTGRRVKVACINWSHPDAPHALAYLYDEVHGIVAEKYCDTWAEAIDYATRWHDPTYGRIDRDIQEMVSAIGPRSLGQRVAMENTAQARRNRGERI